MTVGLHVVEHVTDGAIRADNESRARDPLHFLAVHILFFDHAEFIADFFVGVAEKGVGQVVLLLELLLRFGIVGGDAENYGPGGLQLLIGFAEPASFDGSAGSIGFGKEEENDGLAAELFQRDGVSVLVRQSKLGSFIINLHG